MKNRVILLVASLVAMPATAQTNAPAKAVPAPAAASDAARVAAARTLVQTMRTEQQMRAQQALAGADGEATFDKLVPAQLTMRAQLTDAQGYARARQEAIRLIVEDRQRIGDEAIPLMIDAEVRRYASHYSLEELRALDAFYRSPLGQRVVAEQPKLGAESMQFQQNILAPIAAAHNAALNPKLVAALAPVLRQAAAATPATPPPGKKP